MVVFIKTFSQSHNNYDNSISIFTVLMYIMKSRLENGVSWDPECPFTVDMLSSDGVCLFVSL